ncbi:MAG: hypothetical protein V3S64_01615 [bacterium]
MSNAKWYIIENHNLSSYNNTGGPVVFPGGPNLSALSIDGGVTPLREGLAKKLARAWDKARKGLTNRHIPNPSSVA